MSDATQIAEENLTNLMNNWKGQENEEEDSALALTALITSATRDEAPSYSLRDIYAGIIKTNNSSRLEPLNVLPLLLPSRDAAAEDVLAILGDCNSSKEVVIAAQEATEQIRAALVADEDEDGNQTTQTQSPSHQLVRLLTLYAAAIPRLKLRKKSAFETIRPLMNELEKAINLAPAHATRNEGLHLITAVSQLVLCVAPWATNQAKDATEVTQSVDILAALLDNTLRSFSATVDTSLAQRKFANLYPRFSLRLETAPGWESSERSVLSALEASSALGRSAKELIKNPSLSSLILIAHGTLEGMPPIPLLTALLPALISSLRTNTVLDCSLMILLTSLHSLTSQPSPPELPPDLSAPLAETLSALASVHPDPPTRHLSFRLLSLLLALAPPPLRLSFLHELLRDAHTPAQMRAAGVGLVKEAVLAALAAPRPSPFASPLVLRTFGPVLFRPDPPELFARPEGVDVGAFVESAEPKRLTQCLALYYVLLMRDADNRTGIRDRDMVRNVDTSLLAPLRVALARWLADDRVQVDHHLTMALAGLEVSVERIDDALASIQSSSK